MKRPNAKLTEADIRQIHNCRKAGYTHVMLCQEFGISSTQLARILNGTQWREIWLEFNDPLRRAEEQNKGPLKDPPPEWAEQMDKELEQFIYKPPAAGAGD